MFGHGFVGGGSLRLSEGIDFGSGRPSVRVFPGGWTWGSQSCRVNVREGKGGRGKTVLSGASRSPRVPSERYVWKRICSLSARVNVYGGRDIKTFAVCQKQPPGADLSLAYLGNTFHSQNLAALCAAQHLLHHPMPTDLDFPAGSPVA